MADFSIAVCNKSIRGQFINGKVIDHLTKSVWIYKVSYGSGEIYVGTESSLCIRLDLPPYYLPACVFMCRPI